MWLSIESPNRESKFAIFCLHVLLCLYHQLKRHTAWASQKVLQVYILVDGSSSLLSLSTTGTGSAFLELHTHGQEHGDLHTLSLPPAHPPFPKGCLLASQLGDRSMTVPSAVPALTQLGSVRSGLTASFQGWVLPFLQGWKSWVKGHTVLAFPPALH